SYCKYLALAYCLMTLLQNGVNLGMSQLVGNITQELTRAAGVSPGDSGAPADHSRLIWTCVLWAICALGALSLGIPFRGISTKLDLTIANRLRSRLFQRLLR